MFLNFDALLSLKHTVQRCCR